MATNEQDNETSTRTLFVARAGARLFAVFAEEVEAVAHDLTPLPLPFAPPAIRGVVSLRGRIRTVIDPLRLSDAASDSDSSNSDSPNAAQTSPCFFVALAGDEQLALACDGAEEQFEIAHTRTEAHADPHSHSRGTVERGGERITLLDPARLFDAAMRGTERRRKRS